MAHPNPEDQALYNLGYANAIEMVLSVIDEMCNYPDMDNQFDSYTLDELGQRIV